MMAPRTLITVVIPVFNSLGMLFSGQDSAAGWIALGAFAGLVGSAQLLALGLLGEYVGRTLEQVKGRPLYIVRGRKGFPSSQPEDKVIPAPHFALVRDGAGESGTSKKLRGETAAVMNNPHAPS
jgi:hypothetical protein